MEIQRVSSGVEFIYWWNLYNDKKPDHSAVADPCDSQLHACKVFVFHKGESLATFYGAADKFEAAAAEYRSGLVYGAEKPEEAPLVYALVTKDGVERY